MIISDQQLSAFLDSELPEDEMQLIREQLLIDDELATRLADLAQVDEWVSAHACEIDRHPVPEKITALLQDTAVENKVVSMSAWGKLQSRVSQHAALAAGIALCFGIGIGQLSQSDTAGLSAELSPDIAKALSRLASGEPLVLANQQRLQPTLSFRNMQGQYCRQFSLQSDGIQSDSVACLGNGKWQVKATSFSQVEQNGAQYRTASKSDPFLDVVIDQIIEGAALNKQQEREAINKAWANNGD